VSNESLSKPNQHTTTRRRALHSEPLAQGKYCETQGAFWLRHLRVLRRVWVSSLCILLTGCTATTLFQSSFNTNTVGVPPAQNQTTGTIASAGDPGSVVIVGPVPGSTENWAKISRAGAQSQISTMLCTLSQFPGAGNYTLLAALFIPSGSGLATVEFDTSPQAQPPSLGFLHLDFMQNNTVRIDDNGSQVFGTFPRDQFFTLSVTLDITATSTVAHIGLLGTGTSGTMDYTVTTPPSFALQFGGVKFWMGFPWMGSFDVTDILVTQNSS